MISLKKKKKSLIIIMKMFHVNHSLNFLKLSQGRFFFSVDFGGYVLEECCSFLPQSSRDFDEEH